MNYRQVNYAVPNIADGNGHRPIIRHQIEDRFVLTTQKSAMLPIDWKETWPSEEVCRKSSDITLV